jgi:hypothetical protein
MHARCLPALFLLAACGGGGEKPPAPTISKALDHVLEGQDKAKAQADPKAFEKVKERAAEEAHKAHEAELSALLEPAADAPKDLSEACKRVATAYDTFKQARLADVALQRWNATKEPDLEKLVQHCREAKKLPVAQCKVHALEKAPPTFAESEAEKLLAACEDRFGGGKPG